ncbi:DNA polymerase III subunit epsilon [Myxococcaceae bacterium]|jgi:oligoribonuclease|nr:DNA polymerase III subunit epsilon [Myxococcaceae bacterium]
MAETTLVWLDLEMTGLDLEACSIIEMGILVTGPDLVPRAEFERAIWQPEEVLARMEPFVREMHEKSALLDRVRASRHSLRDVERDALALVASHCGHRQGILAGNSIHTDRRFLAKYMPAFEAWLHYRQLDVSSLKVLASAWYPGVPRFEKGEKTHTALDDLRGSLAELEHYRKTIFR